MLNALMAELTKEWELEQLIPQEIPGTYVVPLEEGVSFSISIEKGPQGNEGIVLRASVASIPKGEEEKLFMHALLGNLFGQGTKYALLGLNDNGTILTLSRLIDYDINFPEFREIIEDFINTLDFWREEALKFIPK